MNAVLSGKRVQQEASLEARMIAERLAKAEVGDLITYAELSKMIGRDVQQAARPALQRARAIVLRSHRMVFECRHKIGVVRMTDTEVIGAAEELPTRVRRLTRRTVLKLCTINHDALTNDDKTRHNAISSYAGALQLFSRPQAISEVRKTSNDGTIAPAIAMKLIGQFKE